MPVDISHKDIARVWCRNETCSKIISEKKVQYLDAYQACSNLDMHLWYPIKPFQNVSIDKYFLLTNNIREVIYPRVLHECSIRIQKSYPKHEIPKPNT